MIAYITEKTCQTIFPLAYKCKHLQKILIKSSITFKKKCIVTEDLF